MSDPYGILIKNDFGDIIISSDIETMHCAGQATYETTTHLGLTDFPSYTGDDGVSTLSGRCICRYYWTAPADAQPLFFIRPLDDAYNLFYGNLNQWYDSGTGRHYIDVIHSGGDPKPPLIFIFVRPKYAQYPFGDNLNGIRTYLPNGTIAFDSARGPLAITYSNSVQPQKVPCDGGQPSDTYQNSHPYAQGTGLDWDFRCNGTYNQYSQLPALVYSQWPMFCAPSIAQAIYSRTIQTHFDSSGWFTDETIRSTNCWWAYYVNGFSIGGGNLRAGWITYHANYQYEYYRNVDSWLWVIGDILWEETQEARDGFPPWGKNGETVNDVPNSIIITDSNYYS